MAGRFPSWQTTLIVDATHWHPSELRSPRRAAATVEVRARDDGALMVTVNNGEGSPEVLMITAAEARAFMRVQDAIFARGATQKEAS